MHSLLQKKALGCIYGGAIGDALGGPTEGHSTQAIRVRYGGYVEGIVDPFFPEWQTARPIAPFHKGNAHVSDDTLMVLALTQVYLGKRDHLDAFDIAERLVPELLDKPTWIPEMEKEALLVFRLFFAEKWLVQRLRYGNVDPREAGVGNMVNCGAAMYMAPVGIANAGDPDGAYTEAIDIAGAHQSSYGREAAGVFAGAVAAAMAPGARASDVATIAIGLAHDGTRAALEAVCASATSIDDWRNAAPRLREAIAPYDTVGPDFRDGGLGARRPSRLHSIEELPIAIGFVLIARGRYEDAVLGAVNYGRDADSIGTMAGAISGALGGRDTVPAQWREFVARESRIDLEEPGLAMADIAEEIFASDDRRHTSRSDAMRRVREGLHAGHVGPA